MDCVIRNYSSAEEETLSKIYYDILHDEFAWVNNGEISLESFKKSTDGEAVYVAYIDQRAVGFVSVWEPDHFIHNLFVSKQYRRLGAGKKLLEKVIEMYEKPVSLKCVKENENAVRFYLNNGWKISKEETGPEGAYYLMLYA